MSPEQKQIKDRIERIEADEAYKKSLEKDPRQEATKQVREEPKATDQEAIKQVREEPKATDQEAIKQVKEEPKATDQEAISDVDQLGEQVVKNINNSNNKSDNVAYKTFRRVTSTKFIFRIFIILAASYLLKSFFILFRAF